MFRMQSRTLWMTVCALLSLGPAQAKDLTEASAGLVAPPKRSAGVAKEKPGAAQPAAAKGGPETAAGSIRIKNLADWQGVRGNQLVGYGLVVGLEGTGD